MAVYTVGLWRVNLGEEEAFIAAWREMAAETESDFPGASAVLRRSTSGPPGRSSICSNGIP